MGKQTYKIQDFIFEIDNEAGIPVPDNMALFRCDTRETALYTYTIRSAGEITVNDIRFDVQKPGIRICCGAGGREVRYLFFYGSDIPYAVSRETDSGRTEIITDERFRDAFSLDTVFVSLLSLERRMDELGHYILHSNLTEYAGRAILFSAPSGGGKSTQGGLWQQYREARIINGDRSLLVRKADGIYACGWPICGSSGICINEDYPVRCVVTLKQGASNEITRLGYAQAVKQLISEITINHHNRGFISRAMDFTEALAADVPVYLLTCDISEDAVGCLEKQLTEDGLLSV